MTPFRSALWLLAGALCLHPPALSQQCDDGYESFAAHPGSRYKLPLYKLDWYDALTACQGDGGGAHLVVINSDLEAEVVKELMARLASTSQPTAWVGINDIGIEGQWVTVTGELLSASGYERWAPGEPSQGGCCSDCGHVYTNALLDDVYCTDVQHFICEKPIAL